MKANSHRGKIEKGKTEKRESGGGERKGRGRDREMGEESGMCLNKGTSRWLRFSHTLHQQKKTVKNIINDERRANNGRSTSGPHPCLVLGARFQNVLILLYSPRLRDRSLQAQNSSG